MENENTRIKFKVTQGSMYDTGSKKNPLGVAFSITFADGTKRRLKARGKNEEDLLAEKNRKVKEAVDEYETRNAHIISIIGANTEQYVENGIKTTVKSKPHTFQEVAYMWFEEFKLGQESLGNSYSNIDNAQNCLKTLIRALDHIDIRAIDKNVAQKIINSISKDSSTGEWYSRSKVEKVTRIFKNIMDYARENHYTDNVIDKIKLNKNLKEPSKDDRFLSKEELIEIREALKDNPRYYLVFSLMMSTGMRQEEVFGLSIGDFREKSGYYTVYISKADVEIDTHVYAIVDRLKHNEEPREVSIPEEVYQMATDYYAQDIGNREAYARRMDKGTMELLFVDKEGKVVNKRTFERSFRNYLSGRVREGLNVTLRMFRHSFASLMCGKIPLEEVSEILGHKSTTITHKYYASETEQARKKAAIASAELFREISKGT